MSEKNSKYYGENGIHRVPLWRIGGFAMNNMATNVYMFMMMYVAYYLIGFVGVGTILASNFAMMMRIWDGVTDPFIGYVVDKTNGKFGKNRPFMIVGQIILAVMSFIMFHFTTKLPEGMAVRFPFFIVCAAIYYIGYTFQCVVTKSAQTCLTNDPKQRPLFSMFDGVYVTLLYVIFAKVAAALSQKYDGFYHQGFFNEIWIITMIVGAVCTTIAVISIAPKDREEFYGTGKPVKVRVKDYWDTIKHNRAIQMLVVAASTDKLASTAKTSTVTAVMFGVVAGNYALYGTLTGLTSIPTMILMVFAIGTIATKLGQRKAMLIGSWGAMFTCITLSLLWLLGDPTSMNGADGKLVWSSFTIIYVILTIIQGGFQGISGNIVIPMTADCADYEVYRSGRYVPGMMGTLFSFVDKLISSFAPMIAGLLYALIGFADKLPDATAAYSVELRNVSLFLMYGLIIIGLICNVIALKFYPLTKEKMEEIQSEIAAIKAKAKQDRL